MADIQVTDTAAGNEIIDLGTLSAVGDTDILVANGSNEFYIFQYVIANLNVSVDIMLMGSLDKLNWFNLNSEVTQKLANGVYAITYLYACKYIKFRFNAEAGGTAATIAVKTWLAKRS